MSDCYTYNFFDLVHFSICYHGTSGHLKRAIAPFRSKGTCKPSVEIRICRSQSDFPVKATSEVSEKYKGIRWRVAIVEKNGREEIYFYVRHFVDFLLPRVVLIPYLKQKLVERGAFILIGSAFVYKGKGYVLFGYPGCGKTRFLLEALSRGARFVGDNQMVVLRGDSVRGVYDEIELRYKTVRNLPFWSLLSFGDKAKLSLFHLTSLCSRRHISFNIALRPKDLGIKPIDGLKQYDLVFVCLGDKQKPLALREAVDAVMQYESWYKSIFGNIFYSDQYWQDMRANLEIFLSHCSRWQMGSQCSILNILHLK